MQIVLQWWRVPFKWTSSQISPFSLFHKLNKKIPNNCHLNWRTCSMTLAKTLEVKLSLACLANLGIIWKVWSCVAELKFCRGVGNSKEEPPLNNLEQCIAHFGFLIINQKRGRNTSTPHPSPHHTTWIWTLTEMSRTCQKSVHLSLTDETK